MFKTRTWIGLLGGILLLSIAACFVLEWTKPTGEIANIYQDGSCIASIDLSQVKERKTYVFRGREGENIVEVEPGRIRIKEADCPDQICVHGGWSSSGSPPIVCLPHRLVIRIEGASQGPEQPELDTVAS